MNTATNDAKSKKITQPHTQPQPCPSAFDGYIANIAQIMGSEVLYERHRKNWTQQELAEKAGVSQRTVSQIEKGLADVSFKRVLLVAAALDLHLYQVEPGDEAARLMTRMKERNALIPKRVHEDKELMNVDLYF